MDKTGRRRGVGKEAEEARRHLMGDTGIGTSSAEGRKYGAPIITRMAVRRRAYLDHLRNEAAWSAFEELRRSPGLDVAGLVTAAERACTPVMERAVMVARQAGLDPLQEESHREAFRDGCRRLCIAVTVALEGECSELGAALGRIGAIALNPRRWESIDGGPTGLVEIFRSRRHRDRTLPPGGRHADSSSDGG